jgi:hypothetical protein
VELETSKHPDTHASAEFPLRKFDGHRRPTAVRRAFEPVGPWAASPSSPSPGHQGLASLSMHSRREVHRGPPRERVLVRSRLHRGREPPFEEFHIDGG